MKTLGMIVGVIGIFALLIPPVGIFLLVVGALLFIAGSNAEKRDLEEQRHQELLEATRNRSQQN